MSAKTNAPTPLIAPTLTVTASQYQVYLSNYQLYRSTLAQIRMANQPAAKPKVPKPAAPSAKRSKLPSDIKLALGEAITHGKKFSSVTVPEEHMRAARDRWEVLSKRSARRLSQEKNVMAGKLQSLNKRLDAATREKDEAQFTFEIIGKSLPELWPKNTQPGKVGYWDEPGDELEYQKGTRKSGLEFIDKVKALQAQVSAVQEAQQQVKVVLSNAKAEEHRANAKLAKAKAAVADRRSQLGYSVVRSATQKLTKDGVVVTLNSVVDTHTGSQEGGSFNATDLSVNPMPTIPTVVITQPRGEIVRSPHLADDYGP